MINSLSHITTTRPDRQSGPGNLHVENRSQRPEGTGQRHAPAERGPGVQRAADACGRAFHGQPEAFARRAVLAELRRGGCAVCQHAKLFRLLLGGNGQQPGVGVFALPERGHIGL